MGKALAIFIPSLNRPHRLEGLVANIREVTPKPFKLYFVVSDDESVEILDKLGVNFWVDNGGSWIERNNFLYKKTDEPYIFLGADDHLFHQNWLERAMEVMTEVDGVVPVNDMLNPNGTGALISRAYIQELSGSVDTENTLIYPGYKHNYADTELFQTAQSRGRYGKADKSIVEHMHWEAGKGERDTTHDNSLKHFNHDQELYNSRRHLW